MLISSIQAAFEQCFLSCCRLLRILLTMPPLNMSLLLHGGGQLDCEHASLTRGSVWNKSFAPFAQLIGFVVSVAPHCSVDNATPNLDFEAVSQQLKQKKGEKGQKCRRTVTVLKRKKIICCVRERARTCPCHVISLFIKKNVLPIS